MKKYLSLLSVFFLLLAPCADASLTYFDSYTGEGAGISIDAVGVATNAEGIIQADIPANAIIEAAYLYSTTAMLIEASIPAQVTFDGQLLVLPPGDPDTDSYIGSRVDVGEKDANEAIETRWDVTSIVGIKYNETGGVGGVIDFTVEEPSILDGEILAVLYSVPLQPVQTAFIFDGELATTGDEFNINLIDEFDGSPAIFSLGISYGFQGTAQFSEIDVNNIRLSSAAGGQDDGYAGDGGLITAGGVGDLPDNPLDPFAGPDGNPRSDDELYNLEPFIDFGADQITINTLNPSNDDNVFFAALVVNGEATVGPPPVPEPPAPVPEPATILLLSTGLLGFAARFRRKLQK